MHVTLAQYNHLSPEDQRRVTSIDASIADGFPVTKHVLPKDEDWDYESCGATPNKECGE